jgi:hypothetical protein
MNDVDSLLIKSLELLEDHLTHDDAAVKLDYDPEILLWAVHELTQKAWLMTRTRELDCIPDLSEETITFIADRDCKIAINNAKIGL